MKAEAEFIPPGTILGYLKGFRETGAVLSWLWRETVNDFARRAFARMAVGILFAKSMEMTYPWLIGLGLEALLDRQLAALMTAFAGAMGVLLAQVVFEWRVGRNIELFVGENARTLDRRINELFFGKEMGLHIEESGLLSQASMEKGRERAERIQHSISFGGLDALLTLVTNFIILCVVNPLAGLVALANVILALLASVVLNQYVISRGEPIEAEFRAIGRRRNELWESVERVETSGRASEEVIGMDMRFEANLGSDRSVWLAYLDGGFVRSVLNIVMFACLTAVVSSQVLAGTATMPELLAVMTWGYTITSQIRNLARFERDINWCVHSVRSMMRALTLVPRVVDAPDAIDLPAGQPLKIELRGVTHAYKSAAGKPVVRDLSFTVPAGESVALLGPSGVGKSTIVRLLLRFMDPAEGAIFINGVDLKRIKLASWRRHVAYIPQKPQILDGTLRDNLLYALTPAERSKVTDEQLWEVMRRFRVDFGDRLYAGLDTPVGRHGVELSGGEAQRVMIAAAALTKPLFMIIDEATSSLDAENQDAVQAALMELLRQGVTAVVIAHRLSAVLQCDGFVQLRAVRDLVNGDSQVEAVASSPRELYDRSPTFRRLAALERVDVGQA